MIYENFVQDFRVGLKGVGFKKDIFRTRRFSAGKYNHFLCRKKIPTR